MDYETNGQDAFNSEQLLSLIESHRGDIENEFGDFTVGRVDYENGNVDLLATAGYDWIKEGGTIAVASLSDRHADARLVIEDLS